MIQLHFKPLTFALLFLSIILSSCSEKGGDDGQQSNKLSLEQVITNDIDGVIRAQYKVLATNTSTFYEALSALETSTMTQEQLEKVCQLFLKARGDYEKSEAFFFGANAHFTGDADINSWQTAFGSNNSCKAVTHLMIVSVGLQALWAGMALNM